MFALLTREISVHTAHGRLLHDTWHESIRLLEPLRAQLELLITDVLPLDSFEQAFELASSGSALKVLLAEVTGIDLQNRRVETRERFGVTSIVISHDMAGALRTTRACTVCCLYPFMKTPDDGTYALPRDCTASM